MTEDRGAEDPSNAELASTMAAKLHLAAGDLKATLSVDEQGFRFVAAQAHACSRDLVLFEALDELQKLTFSCLQCIELCSGGTPDPNDAMTRVAAESVEDIMALLQRKLIETLADLICFSATPEDHYHRDYLLHVQLDGMLSGQRDLKQFYGSESLNIGSQVSRTAAEIEELEAGDLIPANAWYRKSRHPFDLSRAKAGQLFASFSFRLEKALALADDHEKAALGFSYGAGFGRASSGIHARPGPVDLAADLKSASSSINSVIAIGVSVLDRCQEIAGQVPPGQNAWLRNLTKNNDGPTKLLSQGLRGRAEVGDIVMAHDRLGQIREIAEGQLGYQSYLVRFLSDPFLPEIPEDWHRAQEVALVLDTAKVRKMVSDQAALRPEAGIDKLLALPDDRLKDAVAESMGAIDRAGGGLSGAILKEARQRRGEVESSD